MLASLTPPGNVFLAQCRLTCWRAERIALARWPSRRIALVVKPYCSDPVEFDGLVIPTRRRVYPRRSDGRPRSRPVLVWIDVKNVTTIPEG
jgi:hypothetical protein